MTVMKVNIILQKEEGRRESDKVQWSQDRATLTLQLNTAEKEAVSLRNRIRRLEIELEREREKYNVQSSTGETADREKVYQMFIKNCVRI